MNHTMKLNPSPFKLIKEGVKTIELRLYDEKRRQLKIGDIITFINSEDSKELNVRIIDLHNFSFFEELYDKLPLLKCGYTESDIDTAHPDDMCQYYSAEEQKLYGVVGIEICLI